MDLNVRITFDETPAMINSFSALSEAIEKVLSITHAVIQPQAVTQEAPEAIAVKSAPIATPVVQTATVMAPVVPTTSVKQYSLPEIQAACAPLIDAGKTANIAALVQGMGAQSLLQIDKSRYGELVSKLRALGARL